MNPSLRPRLMTSNVKKIAEFKALGIDADIGGPSADLVEPLAEPLFIASYKAFKNGPGSLCEDTRLDIEGAQVGVEAKFLMDQLPALAGRQAVFACCLALCLQDECLVWEARVDGRICPPRGSEAFGFDPFFEPHHANGLNLAELTAQGRKHEFSARAKACLAYATLPPLARFSHAQLGAYAGPWQQTSEA